MKKILVLTAMALIGFSGAAQAEVARGGFYIEPGATYTFKGNGKIGTTNPITNGPDISGSQQGPGATLRVGAHVNDIFFAGLEGLYIRDKFDGEGVTATGNEWAVGAFGGVQMPWIVGLRVWGGYLPYAQVDYDRSNGYKSRFTNGRGWKVGAGFRIAIVSINFEYMKLAYHNADQNYNGSGGFTVNNAAKYDHDAYMVGVSFPLAL
jgi:hypothetical protein